MLVHIIHTVSILCLSILIFDFWMSLQCTACPSNSPSRSSITLEDKCCRSTTKEKVEKCMSCGNPVFTPIMWRILAFTALFVPLLWVFWRTKDKTIIDCTISPSRLFFLLPNIIFAFVSTCFDEMQAVRWPSSQVNP